MIDVDPNLHVPLLLKHPNVSCFHCLDMFSWKSKMSHFWQFGHFKKQDLDVPAQTQCSQHVISYLRKTINISSKNDSQFRIPMRICWQFVNRVRVLCAPPRCLTNQLKFVALDCSPQVVRLQISIRFDGHKETKRTCSKYWSIDWKAKNE